MKKIISIIILVATLTLVGYVLIKFSKKEESSTQTQNNQKITVVTTLFPFYDFAKNIGGDKVEVSLLLPPGAEPHSFEPRPTDILQISSADVFIYTGDLMEPWVDDLLQGIDSRDLIIIDASQEVDLVKTEHGHGHAHHDHENEDAHESDHEKTLELNSHYQESHLDPHFWLDFSNAQAVVKSIAQALKNVQPENQELFENNAERYNLALSNLDQKYHQQLANCSTRKIIYGGHYAFGYLAHRYNLDYIAAQGFSPNSEITAQNLAELTEQTNQEKLNYVFYEELESSKIAEIIAKETNTETLPLSSAHNVSKKDLNENVSFISIMEKNLTNLTKGLSCNFKHE